MLEFKNMSIKRKLALFIVSITFFTLTTGYLIMLANTISNMKSDLTTSTIKNAELIGEYSIVPLAFNDKIQAAKNLIVLDKIPNVAEALLYDDQNNEFIRRVIDSTVLHFQSEHKEYASGFIKDYFYVYRPIMRDGTFYGTIYLLVSTKSLQREINRNFLIYTITLITLIFISYILATVFQKIVTKSIMELTAVMTDVSHNQDYSARVIQQDSNEMGILFEGFNSMLEIIEKGQNELEESKVRLRSYIDNAPDGIFVTDYAGYIVDLNEASSVLTGYTKGELLQMNINDIIIRVEGKGAVSNVIGELVQVGNYAHDVVYVHQNGNLNFWSLCIVEIADNEFLGFAKDINIRKQVEHDLKSLRNYLSNIIDSMPSILIGVDTSCMVTQWNREAEKVTGISTKYALGKLLSEVFPEMKNDIWKIKSSIKTRQVKTKRNKTYHNSGDVTYENITIYPLVSSDVEGAVIRIDDISENVRLEEMMIQSEKMLSVGGLAAGMAHEINNPLAGMIQNANVIINRLTQKLPANIKTAESIGIKIEDINEYMISRGILKQLELINESGQRAARIVHNMLSFARKSESKYIPIDMTALLDKTVELAQSDYNLKRKYDFKNIHIQREYEADLPKVPCDESKIQQVFLNILKNGAEAMAGKDEVSYIPKFIFRIYNVDNSISVEIEDNGPGMNDVTQKRVFEPFYTTKEVGKGSGLGLSVSYFIITENHGGTMSVESTDSKGTKFIIKLPIK
ncbi:MAG: PAS domain S-box protein [Bacteroidales bacterium]|nr:PAS domain S-box protein [Bacteroidales bacterium]